MDPSNASTAWEQMQIAQKHNHYYYTFQHKGFALNHDDCFSKLHAYMSL